jgi:hypothetical protein
MLVVGVRGLVHLLVGGVALGDRGEPPDAVRARVVGVLLLRAVVEGDQRDAVERVVDVGRHLPLGVGLREQVAGRVVGAGRRAGVGRDLLREVPEAIDCVTRDEAARIAD